MFGLDYLAQVVISDIDGTITKSDVLGHFLPVIGQIWAQAGVAKLFSKIHDNGYKIMYLSARALGQATITKDMEKMDSTQTLLSRSLLALATGGIP